MNKTGIAAVFCLVFLGRSVSAKDEKPSFPDDEQINLLLTQTERAFDVYDNAVKLEQLERGSDDQGVKHDREGLGGWRIHCFSCMRPTDTRNISVTASYPWPVPAS